MRRGAAMPAAMTDTRPAAQPQPEPQRRRARGLAKGASRAGARDEVRALIGTPGPDGHRRDLLIEHCTAERSLPRPVRAPPGGAGGRNAPVDGRGVRGRQLLPSLRSAQGWRGRPRRRCGVHIAELPTGRCRCLAGARAAAGAEVRGAGRPASAAASRRRPRWWEHGGAGQRESNGSRHQSLWRFDGPAPTAIKPIVLTTRKLAATPGAGRGAASRPRGHHRRARRRPADWRRAFPPGASGASCATWPAPPSAGPPQARRRPPRGAADHAQRASVGA